METLLDEVSFPLSRIDLQEIQNPYLSRNSKINDSASDIQSRLASLATTIERLRKPLVEGDDDNGDSDDEENVSPEEAARQEHRKIVIDASLKEIDLAYQHMIEIKNLDKLSKETKQKVASQYQFPPGFENMNEKNIDSMRVENFALTYKRNFENALQQYQSIPKSKKYGEDLGYQSMKKEVWEIFHFGTSAPNFNKEFSDYEESDEEMVVEETRQSYKCPLTKQYFESPVTSRVCNHSFSKAAIEHVFQISSNSSLKCPIPSCSHHFGNSDLYPNKDLERLTKRAQARERREHEQFIQHVDTL